MDFMIWSILYGWRIKRPNFDLFFDFSRIFVNYVDGNLLPEGGREQSSFLIKKGTNEFF